MTLVLMILRQIFVVLLTYACTKLKIGTEQVGEAATWITGVLVVALAVVIEVYFPKLWKAWKERGGTLPGLLLYAAALGMSGVMICGTMTGCGSWFVSTVDPSQANKGQQDLLRAEKDYNLFMNTLVGLQNQGLISSRQHDLIEPIRKNAWDTLEAARTAQENGQTIDLGTQLLLFQGYLTSAKTYLTPATQPATTRSSP